MPNIASSHADGDGCPQAFSPSVRPCVTPRRKYENPVFGIFADLLNIITASIGHLLRNEHESLLLAAFLCFKDQLLILKVSQPEFQHFRPASHRRQSIRAIIDCDSWLYVICIHQYTLFRLFPTAMFLFGGRVSGLFTDNI